VVQIAKYPKTQPTNQVASLHHERTSWISFFFKKHCEGGYITDAEVNVWTQKGRSGGRLKKTAQRGTS
jgi:hypothetical protein